MVAVTNLLSKYTILYGKVMTLYSLLLGDGQQIYIFPRTATLKFKVAVELTEGCFQAVSKGHY